MAIEDVTEALAAIALQGPLSRAVLEAATGESFADLRYFRRRDATLAGIPVGISRTGYTGDLGYEVWIPAAHATEAWDALLRRGAAYGIRPAGMLALDVVRLEAGLVLLEVDYTSARHALNPEQSYSPNELGMGRLVDLDKAPFVGPAGTPARGGTGRPRTPARRRQLDWYGIEGLYSAQDLPPAISPAVSRAAAPVFAPGGLRGERQIGKVTSLGWSPILKQAIGLASVPASLRAGRLEAVGRVDGRRPPRPRRGDGRAAAVPRPAAEARLTEPRRGVPSIAPPPDRPDGRAGRPRRPCHGHRHRLARQPSRLGRHRHHRRAARRSPPRRGRVDGRRPWLWTAARRCRRCRSSRCHRRAPRAARWRSLFAAIGASVGIVVRRALGPGHANERERERPVADLVLLLFIGGMALAGWRSGFLRRLIGLAFLLVSFLAGAYLRDAGRRDRPRVLPKIPQPMPRWSAIRSSSPVLLLGPQSRGEADPRPRPEHGLSRATDTSLGAVLGFAEAVLIASAVIVILHTFSTTGAGPPGGFIETGFLKDIRPWSTTRRSAAPGADDRPDHPARPGPLLPTHIKDIVPTTIPGGLPFFPSGLPKR